MAELRTIKVDVVLAPDLLRESEIKNNLCAVIDVLRATSTITTAFANGAEKVIPFKNSTDVLAYAKKLPPGTFLLGGEERSLKIPGFDLGNSPLEYGCDVKGKTVLFSTTNGTPTMKRTFSGSGSPAFIASLLNISAVSSAMVTKALNGPFSTITFVCSGRLGKPSAEDTYCAGIGVQRVSETLVEKGALLELTDQAMLAGHFAWSNEDKALTVLSSCEHGRSLLMLGFREDIEFIAQVDKYDLIPVYNGESIILSK